MTRNNVRKSNRIKDITFNDIKDIDNSLLLEQYNLGSWMKENAGTIGAVAGLGLGLTAMALTGGAAAPLAGTLVSAGASLGSQVGGNIQGSYEADKNKDAQQKMMDEQIAKQNTINKRTALETNLANSYNPSQNYMPTAKYGGNLRKYQTGGTFNYEGQTHEGPNEGIQVGSSGAPVTMSNETPIGLVEGGEVSYRDKNSKVYIFSDTLLMDKNFTFADAAKKIQSKYKIRLKDGVITDGISRVGYDTEMEQLIKKQEQLKEFKGLTSQVDNNMMANQQMMPQGIPQEGQEIPQEVPQEMMQGQPNPMEEGMPMAKYGGYAKHILSNRDKYTTKDNKAKVAAGWKHEDGGGLPKYEEENSYLINPYLNTREKFLNILPNNSEILNSFKSDIKNFTQSSFNKIGDRYQQYKINQLPKNIPVETTSKTTNRPIYSEDFLNSTDFGIKGSEKFSTPKGTSTPYKGMGWGDAAIAAAPGLIGAGAGLLNEWWRKNNNKDAPIKFNRLKSYDVVPEQISLQNERNRIREDANVARANTARGIRSVAGTAGAYMSNVGAAESGIQRNVGQMMGQSYQTEAVKNAELRQQAAMQNAQMRNQTSSANAEIGMQEQMFNLQADNARRSRINQYINTGLGSVSNAVSQKFASNRDAMMMQANNPDSVFMQSGNVFNRKITRDASPSAKLSVLRSALEYFDKVENPDPNQYNRLKSEYDQLLKEFYSNPK